MTHDITQIRARLEALLAKCDAATEGPWEVNGPAGSHIVTMAEVDWDGFICQFDGAEEFDPKRPDDDLMDWDDPNRDSDAAFIAATRTATPELCRCLLEQLDGLEPHLEEPERPSTAHSNPAVYANYHELHGKHELATAQLAIIAAHVARLEEQK